MAGSLAQIAVSRSSSIVGDWFEAWFPGVPGQVWAGLNGKQVLDLAVEAGTWEPGAVREFEIKR